MGSTPPPGGSRSGGQRVALGAARLNRREAGWWWPGVIDLGILRFDDHRRGVLGQVFASRALPDADPHELGLVRLCIPPADAADLGFAALPCEDAAELDQLWKAHIAGLRADAYRRANLAGL